MTDDTDKLTDEDKAFLDTLSERDKQLLELFLTTVNAEFPKIITKMDRITEKIDHLTQEMKDLRKERG